MLAANAPPANQLTLDLWFVESASQPDRNAAAARDQMVASPTKPTPQAR